MQNLRFLFSAAVISLLCCVASFSQQSISPEKQKLIQEFLEVTGGQKAANEMMEMMMAFQEKEIPKSIASLIENDKELTPAQKKEVEQMALASSERIFKRYREFFTEHVNLGKMVEEITLPIYGENFTESELRDLIAFYRTPAGQKMIAVAPKLMMDSMMAFSEKLGPKLQEFMTEATKAEVALLKQNLRNSKGKKPAGER